MAWETAEIRVKEKFLTAESTLNKIQNHDKVAKNGVEASRNGLPAQ